MTEQDARDATLASVSRGTAAKLITYVDLLRRETANQNLIARSTHEFIWSRHIADAVQLVPLGDEAGVWVDIGSGAGLPGIVIALLRAAPVVLVEPRRMRATFLAEIVEQLGLDQQITILPRRIEQVSLEATVISARAVAALPALFAIGQSAATLTTTWVLPKGRTAAAEVALARRLWHADIRMVPSITDSEAAIIVATNVRERRA